MAATASRQQVNGKATASSNDITVHKEAKFDHFSGADTGKDMSYVRSLGSRGDRNMVADHGGNVSQLRQMASGGWKQAHRSATADTQASCRTNISDTSSVRELLDMHRYG
jgi:hypothetical protein